jgi:hypothetical protein
MSQNNVGPDITREDLHTATFTLKYVEYNSSSPENCHVCPTES